MKAFTLFVFVAIFVQLSSCKDNETIKDKVGENNKTESFKPLIRSYSRTDTVRFTQDSTRIAVIGLLQPVGAYLEDSSRKIPVDVLYYVNGKQVFAHTDTFNTREEEELSHYFEGTDTLGNSCERFFTVCFGYPACGYNQWHLTFSADATQCSFVCSHQSMADGAYGSGLDFYQVCTAGADKQITSAWVSRGSETDTGDMITITYSDSAVHRFDGKKWNTEYITPKGKDYRTVKETL